MSIPAQVPTTSIANTAIRQDIDDAGSYYIKPRKPTPIGQKFNRLTIISDAPDTIRKNNSLRRNVQCLCECGKIKTIDYFRVTSGGAQSCGCLQKERASKACKTHGHTVIKHTKEYKAWSHMKQRCINTNDKSYSYYGGRGITVCQQWIESFDAFLNNVGYAPKLKDVSIGRIDNNGNYEPGNVRWEQRADQNLNTRRNVFIEFNGETKTIKEWADLYNLKYDTLRMRLKSGWSVHDALTKELRKWN